jgi:hypothetical protein
MGTSLVSRYYAQSHSNNALLKSLSKDSDVLMWHSTKVEGALFEDAAKKFPAVSALQPVGFSEDQSQYRVDLFQSGSKLYRPSLLINPTPCVLFLGDDFLVSGMYAPEINAVAVTGNLQGEKLSLTDADGLLSVGENKRLIVGKGFSGSLFELVVFVESMNEKKKKRILGYLAARHGLSKRSI